MKSLLGDRSTLPASSTTLTGPQFPFISATRMSILPSVRIPLLRRSEAEEAPRHAKPPLLTMKITSFSFLDATVAHDDSQLELYTISTTSTTTTVTRSDRQGHCLRAALIKWPRVLPTKSSGKEATDGVLVQLRNSQWTAGDSLLKPTGTNSSSPRKFKIPGYSQSMKWKRYGDIYWCTTSSVKGPIAVMERLGRSQPTKITLYETLYDKHDPKSLSAVQGVSVLLLDYIIVTALLLVTDLQEWMLIKEINDAKITESSASGAQASSSFTLASAPKHRKNVYGEPVFPNLLTTEARSKHSSSSTGPMTPGFPETPTSHIVAASVYNYEESYYPSPPASPKPGLSSIIGSIDDSMDRESFTIPDIRSSSPLAESLRFSSRRPSHSHFDPSFYGSQIPPVPSHPFLHSNPLQDNTNISQAPQHSTPLFHSYGRERFHTAVSDGSERFVLVEDNAAQVGHNRISPEAKGMVRSERSNSVRSYASSGGRRPLPKLPPVPLVAPSTLAARRVQSSTQLRSDVTMASSSSSSQPASQIRTGPQRSLPRTPGITIPNGVARSSTTSNTEASPLRSPHSLEQTHSRMPPITKASQEDLTNWVHLLTNPQRDLPPAPLPSTSIFDVPPPAYESINFSPPKSQWGGDDTYS